MLYLSFLAEGHGRRHNPNLHRSGGVSKGLVHTRCSYLNKGFMVVLLSLGGVCSGLRLRVEGEEYCNLGV